MKVALVGAEYEENLSLRYLVAALREAGHETALITFNREPDLPRAASGVMAESPAVVGLSMAFQHRLRDFIGLARRLRELGFTGHITCGGHVPTIIHEQLLADIRELDSVVRHDGELTLLELVERLERGDELLPVAGLTYRAADGAIRANPPRPQPEDLDALPFPDREGRDYAFLGVPFATIVGSRGCYRSCSFCCIHTWHQTSLGPRVRIRSPEDVAAEMELLYHQRGIRVFCFHDDNFFLPKRDATRQRFEALAGELERRGVRDVGLMAKCRPDDCEEELLTWARDRLGLFRVYVGIENGSRAGLQHLNRKTSLETNHRALDVLTRCGIYACYNLLIFEPRARISDIRENLEFVQAHLDHPFNFGRAEVYCGTALEEELRARGRLQGSYLGYNYVMSEPRVEVLFRVCDIAFGKRNFGHDALANQIVQLGYELQLVKRFHPQVPTQVLEDGQRLVEKINYDTFCFLDEACRLAESDHYRDRGRVNDFTLDLTNRVHVQDHFLQLEVKEFRARMKHHVFRPVATAGARQP